MTGTPTVDMKKAVKRSRDKVAEELRRVQDLRAQLRIHRALAKGAGESDVVETRGGRVSRDKFIAYLEFGFQIAIRRVCGARRELFREVATVSAALKCESRSCD